MYASKFAGGFSLRPDIFSSQELLKNYLIKFYRMCVEVQVWPWNTHDSSFHLFHWGSPCPHRSTSSCGYTPPSHTQTPCHYRVATCWDNQVHQNCPCSHYLHHTTTQCECSVLFRHVNSVDLQVEGARWDAIGIICFILPRYHYNSRFK